VSDEPAAQGCERATQGADEPRFDYKGAVFRLLGAVAGSRILDVGCGRGDDVIELARMVGPSGLVIGVDMRAEHIAMARRRTQGMHLPLQFVVGDAHSLTFAAESFDACHADRTLRMLDNPAQGLAEMQRILKIGGRIVVSDLDWGTLVVDDVDRAVTRIVSDSVTDGVRNGWIGRQLYGMFRHSGLRVISVTGFTVIFTEYAIADELLHLSEAARRARIGGLISIEDELGWLNRLKLSGEIHTLMASVGGFAVCGVKVSAPTNSNPITTATVSPKHSYLR
jgi:ubiquinone/menaquinone biosynthesis C-methylase UbiE